MSGPAPDDARTGPAGDLAPPPGAAVRAGHRFAPDRSGRVAAAACGDECVAEEVPIALVYDGHPFAVMMASPVDLTDFALGFSLTEGVVATPDEFVDAVAVEVERGIELRVRVAESRALALRSRARALAGRTGCGLCGVDTIAEALRPVERPRADVAFSADAIAAAVAALPGLQTLGRATGATHAAAFADAGGRILAVREDVGRHNALDKLIGALLRTGVEPAGGFVVVSSRCSYEMVHKTAAAGVTAIVSISAPTGLAVDLADRLGLGLAAFARDGRFTVYAGDRRIT